MTWPGHNSLEGSLDGLEEELASQEPEILCSKCPYSRTQSTPRSRGAQ